jgi:hypothetical protein
LSDFSVEEDDLDDEPDVPLLLGALFPRETVPPDLEEDELPAAAPEPGLDLVFETDEKDCFLLP